MIHGAVMWGLLLSAAQAGQSGTIIVPVATIRYEAVGSGAPLVLIHGWAQDMSIWDEQVRAFSARYRVIRYDRRGFGQSTGHADASADPADLAALLDSLGVRSAHLLGLSAGSRTAIDFAVAFPDRVRSLIAYGQPPLPGFSPMPDGPPPVAVFGDIARTHGLDSAGRLLQAHPLAWMPPERPELQELLKAMWARYRGRDLLDPRPESGRTPAARLDQVAGLRVPVMVVSGDHELPLLLQVADTLVRRIKGSQRVVIENAGHGAHFAQPALFNAAVLRFLDGVDRGRGHPPSGRQ